MSDCMINPYSSCVCVLGTKSCVMKHTGIVERDKRIAELEEKIKGSEVYLKEGETIVQCLERNRRDAANARVAESKFREDAERYRLHRTGNHSDVLMEVPPGSDNWEPLTGDHLDKATDAAMEGEYA